jgi:FPC/CPF motif-containing protein YcgG
MPARKTPSTSATAWPDVVRATGQAFAAFIGRHDFPCLGAKAAHAQGQLQCLYAHDIAGDGDDAVITRGLQDFAARANDESLFVSIAVLFPLSSPLSEKAFEDALWQRLGAIHALDRVDHGWDDRVSADPASPHFSMSIGGQAFYIVGLHPGASRPARRFDCPAMVFNLHSQFERLRADGRYEKLRQAIVERDIALAGSPNPMLAVHGKSPEARQYSGRKVDAGWTCPFHPQPTEKTA